MSGLRFGSFSFVDRIHSVEPGQSVEGSYDIPDSIGDFRHALCCEAVGQCAAWSAMASLDFQYQPVAGISQSVEFFGQANPGDTLALRAEISRADAEAVTYDGWGSVDGSDVVRLHGCLGPMLPMVDFDDPERMQARYAELCEDSAETGRFTGVPHFEATDISEIEAGVLGASFQVPGEGDFFADHFPRKPVFPGTLFMDLCTRFGAGLVGEGAQATGAHDSKLRDFMEPGAQLDLQAKLEDTGLVGIYLSRGKRFKRVVKISFEV